MSCPQKKGTARGGSRSLRIACGFLWGLFCSIRRLTAIVSHASVSLRRRLYQRAVHALGGVTGGLGGNLRGIEDASKGLGCRLGCCLPVADVQHRPTRQRRPSAGRCPPGTGAPASFLSRKLGKELHPSPPRMCASLLMSTSEASCHWRDLPGVQPPRTCADGSHRHGVQSPLIGAICLGCNPRGRALTVRKGAAFSRRPRARIARGATPADVR